MRNLILSCLAGVIFAGGGVAGDYTVTANGQPAEIDDGVAVFSATTGTVEVVVKSTVHHLRNTLVLPQSRKCPPYYCDAGVTKFQMSAEQTVIIEPHGSRDALIVTGAGAGEVFKGDMVIKENGRRIDGGLILGDLILDGVKNAVVANVNVRGGLVLQGGCENVTVTNCLFWTDGDDVLRITDGRDLRFTDIDIMHLKKRAIVVRGEKPMANFVFENLRFSGTVPGNELLNVRAKALDGLVVRDLTIPLGGKGLPVKIAALDEARGITGVKFERVHGFGEVSLTGKVESEGLVSSRQAPRRDGYRFLAFNIWGDFFGNPVEERDLQTVAAIRKHAPDFIGMQEVTYWGWWRSRLSALADEYDVVGETLGPEGLSAADPVCYRRDRFTLLDQGAVWFCPELDVSKGAVWAALEDKRTKKRVIIFASHFWWMSKSPADEFVRLLNARMLHAELTRVAKKYGAAVVGGGDLNSPVTASGLTELKRLGWCDAQETTPGADKRATEHGDPVRGADGCYHGLPPDKADPKEVKWLDHVFYTPESVVPLKFSVDTDQAVLDISDHSPVIFDFRCSEK